MATGTIGLDQGPGATRRCCNLCSSDTVPEDGWEKNAGYCDECVLNAPRVGGDMICPTCGKEYKRHPMAQIVGWLDQPYLTKLCDARLVKL